MKRGLASPCVHSALATTRRSRDQLSSVDHRNSLKRRAGFPLASAALHSAYARQHTDPDFRMNGTHTYFPLSPTRMLILTNLSWARNPYGNAEKLRPNPQPFRTAIFMLPAVRIRAYPAACRPDR